MEHPMKTRILLTGLFIAPAFVMPASANWFSNPSLDINLNLGSAPSPTPSDVLAERQPMLVRDADGNVIAMIDPSTGKIVATADPPAPAKPAGGVTQPIAAKASAR